MRQFAGIVFTILCAVFVAGADALADRGDGSTTALDIAYAEHFASPSVLPDRFREVATVLEHLDADQRRAALRGLAELASLYWETEPEVAGAMTNYIAYRHLHMLDDLDGAIRHFRRVADDERSVVNRIDACCMMGQLHAFAGEGGLETADRYYRIVLELCEQHGTHGVLLHYLDAISKLAYIQRESGNREEAIRLRDRLLAEPNVLLLGEDEPERLYICNARDYAALGRVEEAVAAYERVREVIPGFGEKDGQLVWLRHEQLLARAPDRMSREYLDGLWAIWDDPELQRFEGEMVRIGHRIATRCLTLEDDEGQRRAFERLRRDLDGLWPRATEKDRAEYRLDDIYVRTLVELGNLYRRDGAVEEAMTVYQVFLQTFPEHPMFDEIARRLDRLSGR